MSVSASEHDLFIDGMLDVSFSRGIVRVDLYSLSATEKVATGGPKPDFRRRLVMSTQSFVEFVNGLQVAAQSLRERGVLPGGPAGAPLRAVEAEPADEEMVEMAAEPAPAAVVDLGAPRPKGPRSPNFNVPSPAET